MPSSNTTPLIRRMTPFFPSPQALGICIATYVLTLFCAWVAPHLMRYGPTRGSSIVYKDLPWYHNWDGLWYYDIIEYGYFYDPVTFSSVAFYPLYTLLAMIVKFFTGLSTSTSLVAVNVVSLVALCGIWEAYCRQYAGKNSRFVLYALCLLLFYPSSFYLRVAYPMALTMALMCLMLYGFRKRWPLHYLMYICILLSATHSSGLMFIPALGWHAWNRLGSMRPLQRLLAIGGLMFLSASGLWLFMLYQWAALGNPFYFIMAQKAWRIGEPIFPRLFELITFVPVWYPLTTLGQYDLLGGSKIFFNHGLFLIVILIFIYGCSKRWLNAEEMISTGLMIVLFYYFVLNQGEQQWSTGRYSMIFMPCYLILSRIMLQKPKAFFIMLLLISELMMCYYLMRYERWYAVF